MKRNWKRKIIIAFVILSFTAVKAQDSTNVIHKFKPYHDVRLTLGTQKYELILPLILENLGEPDYEMQMFNFHPDTYYNGAVYTTGSLSASYVYQITKKLGLGATMAYCSYYNNYLDAETNEIVGKSVRNHIGVYPKMYNTWFSRPKFSIYSSIGLGVGWVFRNNTVDEERTHKTYWNITGQYTLLGFTIGEKLYATGEILGFGTEGLVKIGVGYRFNSFKKL